MSGMTEEIKVEFSSPYSEQLGNIGNSFSDDLDMDGSTWTSNANPGIASGVPEGATTGSKELTSEEKETYKLYVRNLPRGILSSELLKLFQPYGKVIQCEVIVKNYAFVHMESKECGLKAMAGLNNMNVKGVNINVQEARNKTIQTKHLIGSYGHQKVTTFKLFISNSPPQSSKESITNLLLQFGRVVEVQMLSPISAFVHVENEESGKRAISGLHGKVLDGNDKPLIVAESNKPGGPNVAVMKLLITNVSEKVSAAQLRDLFNKYGMVIESKITPSATNEDRKAVVHLEALGDIRSALKEMNGYVLDGLTIKVEPILKPDSKNLEGSLKYKALHPGKGVRPPPLIPQKNKFSPQNPGIRPLFGDNQQQQSLMSCAYEEQHPPFMHDSYRKPMHRFPPPPRKGVGRGRFQPESLARYRNNYEFCSDNYEFYETPFQPLKDGNEWNFRNQSYQPMETEMEDQGYSPLIKKARFSQLQPQPRPLMNLAFPDGPMAHSQNNFGNSFASFRRSAPLNLPRQGTEMTETNGSFGRGQQSASNNATIFQSQQQNSAAVKFPMNSSQTPPVPPPEQSQVRGGNYYNLFADLVKLPLQKRSTNKAVKEFQELNIDYQLLNFINSITMTQGDLIKRSELLTELADLVKISFPRCILYPFGSMSSGLGDHLSDIDIYADIFGETSGVQMNPFEGSRPTKQEIILDIKKLLRTAKAPNNRPKYGQIIPILKARVPILKFFHVFTKINVDMSFENLLSTQNTKMISFIMTLDKSVRPLLLLVRYWGKFHELTGSTLIKNYALLLMVLVFLSNKKIIPTVHHLQSLPSPTHCIIDGWNAGFCENKEFVLSSFQKGQSFEIHPQTGLPATRFILKLAQEFFHTCAHTDFSTNMICSLTSEFIAKKNFYPGNEQVLPQTLERYKNWSSRQSAGLNISTPFVLQDPFQLSFNVGAVTTEGTLLKFQVACAQTATILNENLKSILDLFIPLPRQFGEKKFMSMLRIRKRHEQLKQEIKGALGKASGQTHEETLPLHLLPIDEIISKKTIQYSQGWETFLCYSMGDSSSKTFRELFCSELNCLTANDLIRQVDLENKMKSLWVTFVKEFLEEVWIPCFGAKHTLEEVSLPMRRFSEFGNLGRSGPGRPHPHPVETEVDGVVVENVDHGQVESQEYTANEIQSDRKYNLDKDTLLSRLNCLKFQESSVSYFRYKCTADTPFWTNRENYRYQALQNKTIAEDGQYYFPGSSKTKKKAKRASRREKQLGNLQMADPMLIEKQIMKFIIENYDVQVAVQDPDSTNTKPTANNLFQCNCWVKVDSSYVDDWPEVVFILEMDSEFTQNYTAGGYIIMTTLRKLFPDFMFFKLIQWFAVQGVSDESSNVES